MTALDASALLAFLFREAGCDRAAAEIDGSCMTTVNLCEVLGRFARDGHAAPLVLARLGALGIEWVPFDESLAALAAGLVPATRRLGLSLGDRACLALGMSRGVPVVTTDANWGTLDVGVEIRCVR